MQQGKIPAGAKPSTYIPGTTEFQRLQPPWDHDYEIWFECDTQQGYSGPGGKLECTSNGDWVVVMGQACQLTGNQDTLALSL